MKFRNLALFAPLRRDQAWDREWHPWCSRCLLSWVQPDGLKISGWQNAIPKSDFPTGSLDLHYLMLKNHRWSQHIPTPQEILIFCCRKGMQYRSNLNRSLSLKQHDKPFEAKTEATVRHWAKTTKISVPRGWPTAMQLRDWALCAVFCPELRSTTSSLLALSPSQWSACQGHPTSSQHLLKLTVTPILKKKNGKCVSWHENPECPFPAFLHVESLQWPGRNFHIHGTQ